MFEESLVESSPLLRTRNRWPAILSTAFYTAAALALISFPMLHPEVLSLHAPSLIYFVPPPRPTPPPPQRVHLTVTPTTSAAASYSPPTLANTTRILPSATPTAEEAPNFNPTGIPMGSTSSVPSGIATTGNSTVHVVSGSSGSGGPSSARLSISRGVSAGLLLTPIRPIYPRIAISAHREGTVIVQAIISKTGQIESAHILSGDIMLQSAALEAVRNARYRPYLLNGEPTEVDTTFNINFLLGGG